MGTRFVLLNDVHLYRGPATRLDNYEDTVFGKLAQVATLAEKVEAKAVLIAGDIFHEKKRVGFGTIHRLMEWGYALQARGIRVLAIPGNHDESHDRIESIRSQALGVVFTSNAITDVSYRPVLFDDIAVVGVPYPDAKEIAAFDRLPARTWRRGILMAHCFATVEGGEYFGEPIHRYADFAGLPFDVLHFGHDHSDHGVVRIENQWFVNLGALTRGSLSEDEITREVKVGMVEFTETRTVVQQVRLATAPASEVFDLALHQQKVRERREIEEFVADLSTRLDAAGPVDLQQRLTSMGLADEVRTRVLQYLSSADEASPEDK